MKKTKKLNTAVLISGVLSAALYTLPAQSQPVDNMTPMPTRITTN